MKHGKPDDEFGQEVGFNAVKKVPFPWRLRRLKVSYCYAGYLARLKPITMPKILLFGFTKE